MDKYAKNRAKFKDKFKKVTKSDYDDLSPMGQRKYDAAKRLGLVVGAKPGTFTKIGAVTVFDPKTYERVSNKELNVGVFVKPKSKREPFKPSPGDKEYDTDIGMALPTRRPLLKSQLKKAGKDFMNGGAVMPNRGGKFKGVF